MIACRGVGGTPSCANESSFFKVGDVAQLIKVLVAYWLGALLQVADSNTGGFKENYVVMYMLLIFIALFLNVNGVQLFPLKN